MPIINVIIIINALAQILETEGGPDFGGTTRFRSLGLQPFKRYDRSKLLRDEVVGLGQLVAFVDRLVPRLVVGFVLEVVVGEPDDLIVGEGLADIGERFEGSVHSKVSLSLRTVCMRNAQWV